METAKLFMIGNSQTVRLPKSYRFSGDEVVIKQARQDYLNQKFAAALQKFAEVLAIDQNDKAAILHQQRCQYWLENQPKSDWDGIETLTEK